MTLKLRISRSSATAHSHAIIPTHQSASQLLTSWPYHSGHRAWDMSSPLRALTNRWPRGSVFQGDRNRGLRSYEQVLKNLNNGRCSVSAKLLSFTSTGLCNIAWRSIPSWKLLRKKGSSRPDGYSSLTSKVLRGAFHQSAMTRYASLQHSFR